MKIALVCIAKDEDNYIDEWIEYHKKLGFDDIFIYQNNWRYSKKKPNVIKIEFDGEEKQDLAYNEFISNYKGIYDWAAFLDVDEFLVLHKHKNIQEFIQDYKEYKAVAINWLIFGDNSNKSVIANEYSLLKRFTKRAKEPEAFIKCIVNLSYDFYMTIHFPLNIEVIDTSFNKIKLYTNEGQLIPIIDVAQINHYFCKTYPEFLQKIERGRADSKYKRTECEFNGFNKNEVEDYSAFNFLYEKENIIQIGCNIGNDHVKDYVSKNKQIIQNLILVDANEKSIEMCKHNYSEYSFCKFFNLAIVDADLENVEFFVPDNNNFSEQSSVLEFHVQDHLKFIGCENYNKIVVPALNINVFLENLNLNVIDKLYIDIEGLDIDIILSLNLNKFKIKYIYFEHTHSDGSFSNLQNDSECLKYKKCIDILSNFGYTTTKLQFNTIAMLN